LFLFWKSIDSFLFSESLLFSARRLPLPENAARFLFPEAWKWSCLVPSELLPTGGIKTQQLVLSCRQASFPSGFFFETRLLLLAARQFFPGRLTLFPSVPLRGQAPDPSVNPGTWRFYSSRLFQRSTPIREVFLFRLFGPDLCIRPSSRSASSTIPSRPPKKPLH